jgi:predicted nucleic acid-binding protein
VLPVEGVTAGRAKEVVMEHRKMKARDPLHVATMEQHGIEKMLSFDSGFDGFPGVARIS